MQTELQAQLDVSSTDITAGTAGTTGGGDLLNSISHIDSSDLTSSVSLLPWEILQSLSVLSKFDGNTKPREILNLAERLYDQCARHELGGIGSTHSINEPDAGDNSEVTKSSKSEFFSPSALSLKISSVRETHKNKNTLTLKEKISARYVSGDKYKITHAKEVLVSFNDDALKQKKKNFGGSGVTCGNLYKGIKNAKRFKDNPIS